MYNTSKYILENCAMPGTDILRLVSGYDAAETLNCPGKWPRSYICMEQKCPKCKSDLAGLVSKKQKNKSDKKLLITKLHVIPIEILTKKCRKCYLIISPDTMQYGLMNIGDTTLVALDIFFTLRNTIRSTQWAST